MAKRRHRVCVLYSHCLIAINNRVSSSTGAADLLRIPPWMKEAAIVLEVDDDDDDGLLSASSDERWARYRSFCFVFFEVFMTFSQFLLRHSLYQLFSFFCLSRI